MSHTVLHLGFQKTGTTTLQKHVFPNMVPLSYSARSTNLGSDPQLLCLPEILTDCRYLERDRLALGPSGDGYLDTIGERFSRARTEVPDGQPLLVSCENIFSPHPDGMTVLPGRFRSVVGPARVILVIREPVSFFTSLYRQFLINGLSRLDNSSTADIGSKMFLADAKSYFHYHFDGKGDLHQYFELDGSVAALDRQFGRENVLLLHFDRQREDFAGFVLTLCDFIGVNMKPDFGFDTVKQENVAQGRIQPILNRVLAAEKINEGQANQLRDWYDNCDLKDDQARALAAYEKQFEAALEARAA